MEKIENGTLAAARGECLAEISTGIVKLYSRHYGKGPMKAKTHLKDDVVVCILRGGTEQPHLAGLCVGKQRCTGWHIALHERGAIQVIQHAYELGVEGARVALLPLVGEIVRQA